MPTPAPGESLQDFVKRCIPEVIRDKTAEDSDEAVAICNSLFEQDTEEGIMKQVPASFRLMADLEIQADKHDPEEDAKEMKPVRFMLKANTGKPMLLEGFFHPLVIDITGAKFVKRVTPVIADHDTSQRIGHTTEQAIIPFGGEAIVNGKTLKGPMIAAAGIVSSQSQTAQDFIADSKSGFPFEVSVGGENVEVEFVAEGESTEVNGKTMKGPLIVSRKSVMHELTIAVLGADRNTSAKLAAQRKPNPSLERNLVMDFQAYVKSLHLDPENLSEETKVALQAQHKSLHPDKPKDPATVPAPIKATPPVDPPADPDGHQAHRDFLAAETLRTNSINAVATRFGEIQTLKVDDAEVTLPALQARAIKDGWTADQLELHCRRAERPVPSGGPAIHSVDRDIDGEALQCSMLRFHGTLATGTNTVNKKDFGLESMFTPKVLESSHAPQYKIGGSIQALFDMQIRAAGKHFTGNRKGSGFIQATHEAWTKIRASHDRFTAAGSGFSVLDIVQVLENVMNKVSYAAFSAVESIWPFISGRRPLNDFKPHTIYRLDFDGDYRQVAVDGELKHISLKDTKHLIQADTFGAMVSIDRKTITNDDLGMVLAMARGLGTLGAQRIEESIFVLLLSNPSAFFSAGNGNLLTGASSVLGVDGITDARTLFRNQVVNGKPVAVSPSVLLVGTTLETTANRLWSEERMGAAGGGTNEPIFINNPHRGIYRPHISGYLNNVGITDQNGVAITGQSGTQWYLFGDPSSPLGSALVIGFLNGRESPFFDEAETNFNIPGGIQFRSYLDWGVAMHVTQLAMKSNGV